jgi:hypothetical protein
MNVPARDHNHDRYAIRRLTNVTDGQIRELALVLIDCVDGGASVSFMHPLPSRTMRYGRTAVGAARPFFYRQLD